MILLAIFSVKGCNYRTNFWQMSKDDAINIMKNSDLKKSWLLSKKLLLYINI